MKLFPLLAFLLTFLLINDIIFVGEALSMPISMPDLSYTTGTTVLISSSWNVTTTTSFLVTYQTTMSTNSLNGTLGVMGFDSYIRPPQWGWRFSIASLNQTSLNVNFNVKNAYSPVISLQICYLVTSNTLLELNSVNQNFYLYASWMAVANYSLGLGNCFIDCRSYIYSQAFRPKTGGKVIVFLSGVQVQKNVQTPNRNTYFGVTVEPTQPSSGMTSSFSMNITVYGGAELSFLSFYYISFEPAALNIINYRQVIYGNNSFGCFYTPNTCSSMTTFYTSRLGTMSYNSNNPNNFFVGVYKFIMNWQGDTTTITNTFKINSISQYNDSTIRVNTIFTGNPYNQYHLGHSYFTLQTFACPTVGTVDIYAVYNSNWCDSSCNSSIQQYANATNFCLPCSIYCYTCAGSDNFCTSCNNGQNRALVNNFCGCDTGFYDNGNLICPICHFSCKTCNNSGLASCLSCQSANKRMLVVNMCSCMFGYYEINSVSCSACHYTCQTATCINNINLGCTSCNLSMHRVQLANFTCGCTAGYYDNSTNTEECAPCIYQCLTCWGSNTLCLTCSSANFRYLTTTGNNCSCKDSYYDSGVATCSKCPSTCLTCNGPSVSNCLSCNITLLRTLIGSTCVCGQRYYDNNNVCSPCSYSCLNCTNAMATSCTSCNSLYRVLNTTTNTCDCFDGYYDVGVQICSKCSSACLTCVTSPSTCTSCHNNPGRYYSGASFSCLCNTGYVDTTFDSYCTLCHYSCLTCSGTVNNCVLCASNRVWNGTVCACPDGTYDNGFNSTCQTCPLTCAKCSSGLSTSCTGCDPTYFRYLSPSPTGACICSPSYYDAGVLFCQPCSAKCLTCWGSSTYCTSCDNTVNHRLISNISTCDCVSGYLEVGLTACMPCSITCLTCSILPTNCTSCSPDRALTSGSCLCNFGYFQNSSSLCQVCSYLCQTCISLTYCLTCRPGTNRVLNGSTCQCTAGYLQTNTASCLPCSYTCASCAGFASVCSSCPANSFRSMNSSQNCSCIDGYYDNGVSPICLACSNICLTCTLYSQCLSCNSSLNRIWDSLALSCPCTINYYDSGSVQCSRCHYSCATCLGPLSTNCNTCPSNRLLSSSSCPCISGYYDLLGVCTSCSISCKTCSVSPSNCTSCPSGSYLLNNQCTCLAGYFLNANICDVCDSSCYTCLSTATLCTSCNLAQGRVLNGSSCICQSNMFLNSWTSTCQSCNTRCLTCSNSSQYSCLTCDSTKNRLLNPNTLTCDCKSGYYESGSFICQVCVSPCLTCNGATVLNCTSCIAGYTLIGSSCVTTLVCPSYSYQGLCISTCPSTAYPSGNICNPCINNCLTCSTATFCLTCRPNYLFYNNTCVLACPINTYRINNSCLTCPLQCAQCTSFSNELICLSCQAGYYLLNYSCISQCLQDQKYVLVGQNCMPCLFPCLKCVDLSSNGCITCSSSYYLFQGMCLKECPESYVPINSTCIVCPSNCSKCSNNNCLKCNMGFYLTQTGGCSPIGSFINSLGSYIKCHPNCISCTDSSFSSCIACAQFRGDSSGMAVRGYCDCWIDSLDLGNGTCDRQSYKSLKEFTAFLVTATTSVNYFSTLSGVVSMNFMATGASVFYQQTYSNFYFLNSSAVLQTDAVLDRYGDTSLIRLSKSKKDKSNSDRDQYGRRLDQYVQNKLQDDESLFMKGGDFQYLFDWGLIIFIATISLWVLKYILWCISKKIEDKKSKIFLVTKSIQSFLDESAIILLLVFTSNQVFLYSVASFKIIAYKYPQSIDSLKLVLSCLFFCYYVFYLIKLFLVSLKDKPSQQNQQKYRLLYSCFQTSKLTRKICRIYLPALLLRSLLIAIFIVSLSFSAQLQAFLSLLVIIVWDFYSFFACPYHFYVKLFIRFHQLIFTVQIGLLAMSAAFPQNSRLGVAVGLMVMNFLQTIILLGLGVSILFYKLLGMKCLKRNQNAIKPLDNTQKEASRKQTSLREDTMEQFERQNKTKKQNFSHKKFQQILADKSQISLTIENIDLRAAQAEQQFQTTRKKYRVKKKQNIF